MVNPELGEKPWVVPFTFAQELERENAALREALDAQMQYQRDLRADRDRLDCMERNCSHLEVVEAVAGNIERFKINATRASLDQLLAIPTLNELDALR
jgi:hypothetical protein